MHIKTPRIFLPEKSWEDDLTPIGRPSRLCIIWFHIGCDLDACGKVFRSPIPHIIMTSIFSGVLSLGPRYCFKVGDIWGFANLISRSRPKTRVHNESKGWITWNSVNFIVEILVLVASLGRIHNLDLEFYLSSLTNIMGDTTFWLVSIIGDLNVSQRLIVQIYKNTPLYKRIQPNNKMHTSSLDGNKKRNSHNIFEISWNL